ncbi:MAG TPA: DUF998 domain-containing protein [Rhodanobacteraceae bacterium]|nr:DUF998 domain-containing protein [Rhodanobacteraceae bacterium]
MTANPHPDHASARDETSVRSDALTRALGVVTLLGVAVITVICITVQFLRTDLDWIATAMSLYVIGPYGAWVQAAFFAPAPGIAALGIGWYRALDRHAHNLAPLVLFVVAAAALCIAAAFVTDKGDHPVTVHGQIHQWAAFGTFVCVTTAMLVQSVRLHLDRHWRGRFPGALTLAVITAIYFWIYALAKPIPRGLGEKVVIGLVLLWLWRAAWWLVRDGRRPA